MNLSKHKLSEAEESILSKGPGYATVPKIDPIDFAAPIEAALGISKASDQEKETVRIKICEAIRRAKRPSANITKDEREAWTKLKKNKSIQIVQADKGNATVILDAKDYDAKVHALLDDQKSYSLLKKDPTKSTERKFLDVIRDLKKKKKIVRVSTKKFVRPKDRANRRFFTVALSYTRRGSHWDRLSLLVGLQLTD